MLNTIKNKKAGVPLAIVLLTIAVFVLITLALFTFSFKQTKWSTTISSAEQIQETYFKAEILNFYLNQVCGSTNVNSGDNPAEKFKQELEKYKADDGKYVFSDYFHINFIEKQIDSQHIFIENNVLKVNFDITFGEKIFPYPAPRTDYFDVAYNYQFKCEKKLPVSG